MLDYEMRFTEFSRYATFLIRTESKKVRRFIEWLNIGICLGMDKMAES